MRAVASRTSGVVSHSTVHQALSGKRIPRWGALELIIEALGGDPSEFHSLWKDLRLQARQYPGESVSQGAPVSEGYRFRLERIESIPHVEEFLTLDRASQIKKTEGPLAAAQYLAKHIGKRWNSSLMTVYLPLLEEAGQEAKVAQIVPHLRGIDMQSAEASHLAATIFDELEDFAEAVRHGKAALRRDPNNAKYAWLVGSYLASMELVDESHSYYELANRLDRSDSDFAESYITSLLARSEFSRVVEVARHLWSDEGVRVYAGVALALQGSFAEAEQVLRSVSRLHTDGVRALAQVLLAMDRSEEALTLLADRFESHPDDLKSGAMYVELLRGAGETDMLGEALRRLEAGAVRERENIARVVAKIRAAKQGQ
ncbi:hypothetical protein ABZ784_10805 [Streptomyces tendae]|uniref:tetratricopeptide repeat protein n=1 Tax=Streptomyces tendae TaxID=1932 RepID=UPI0033C48B3F